MISRSIWIFKCSVKICVQITLRIHSNPVYAPGIISTFLLPPFLGGKRITKVVVKSHFFLLDHLQFFGDIWWKFNAYFSRVVMMTQTELYTFFFYLYISPLMNVTLTQFPQVKRVTFFVVINMLRYFWSTSF